MGYGVFDVGDGILRGYGVPDECGHQGCSKPIDRGLAYLCAGCSGYYCAEHLLVALVRADEETGCYAATGQMMGDACAECAKFLDKDGRFGDDPPQGWLDWCVEVEKRLRAGNPKLNYEAADQPAGGATDHA